MRYLYSIADIYANKKGQCVPKDTNYRTGPTQKSTQSIKEGPGKNDVRSQTTPTLEAPLITHRHVRSKQKGQSVRVDTNYVDRPHLEKSTQGKGRSQ